MCSVLFVVYIWIGLESISSMLVVVDVLSVMSRTEKPPLRVYVASVAIEAGPKFNINASSSLFDVDDQ